ncbi:MAG: ABC transporter substrate-binding protein [Spirochaetes bacterium]|nr:ABC transporter substrate-binding protein [Spirochaetota bacterium]
MKIFKIISLIVIHLLIITVSGCSTKSDTSEKDSIFKIGAILSITGPYSRYGSPQARTLKMLVEKINSEGMLWGKKLRLIIKDSKGDPETAFQSAKNLINTEKVIAIIGPSTTDETLKIRDICNKTGTTMISLASADSVLQPLTKYVFKTSQKNEPAVEFIFQIMQKMKIMRIGLIHGNSLFGKEGKDQINKLSAKYGIKVLISEQYNKKTKSFTRILKKLKNKKVKAIINWSDFEAQTKIAKDMSDIYLSIPLFHSYTYGNIEYIQKGGQPAEGVVFPCGRLFIAELLQNTHIQKKLLLNYKKVYSDEYSENVSLSGGYAYDALSIIIHAVKKTGISKSRIRDTIENLKAFTGITGVFTFSKKDHNGLNIESLSMYTINLGKFVLFKAH